MRAVDLSGGCLDRGFDRAGFRGHGSGVSGGRLMVGGGIGQENGGLRHRARV
jgi:hypothetical protein